MSIVFLALATSGVGCSRSFWRRNADKEVYGLLPGKMTDPRWALPRFDITPDPASRFFDPYPPDKGPMPPDDPAANEYMQRVNSMRQSKTWHKFGETLSIENPQWLASFGLVPSHDGGAEQPSDGGIVPPPLPANGEAAEAGTAGVQTAAYEKAQPCEDPAVCRYDDPGRYGIEGLTLQQALELSYIHSREYQTEIEDLYLSALDLTFDRFQFNVRYLGIGRQEPAGDLTFQTIPQGQNSLMADNRFGVSKLLPTGAQMAVELANNTVWLFAGPNQTNTASVLSYSLVQPLLLGAGRRVVLESLTQRERNTLYATRDLARFRKTFFSDVVAGGQGGFLGILQQMQVISNQENNIRQLEKQLDLLRALESQRPQELPVSFPAGLQIPNELTGKLRYDAEIMSHFWRGDMTAEQEGILRGLSNDPEFQKTVDDLIGRLRSETVTLDVALLEVRLANSRNALRQSQARLQDSLEQFQIQLGLPPDFRMSIDDALLDQFALIDTRFFVLEKRIDEFVGVWAQLNEEDPDIQQLRSVAAGLNSLALDVDAEGLELIEVDLRRVDENMPERLSRLESDEQRETVLGNVAGDRRLFSSLRKDYSDVGQQLTALITSLNNDALNLDMRRKAVATLALLREQLLKVAQSLQVIQAGLRVELIHLQPFDMGLKESMCRGLDNRLDLKNARAQVMDARRRQEVAANQLEAVLDIVAAGDVRTRPLIGNEDPFDFRGRRSSFRVGARFTAPLDQISERNAYRLALIDYQRARRDYMALEDQVKFSVRTNWRQIQVLAKNFETARKALRIAANQLDLAVEEASAPPRPGQQRQGGQQGQDLLNALNGLLGSLNDLIGIWVNYERSRINIYRDMGMMEIDERGVWNDSFYQQSPPLTPTTSHAPQQQPGKPITDRHGTDGGPVFVRRGDTPADGGQAALGQFTLPRKIELIEDPAGRRGAAGPRNPRLSGNSPGVSRRE